MPKDGVLGARHNISAATLALTGPRPGTIVKEWQPTLKGWSIFIYLKALKAAAGARELYAQSNAADLWEVSNLKADTLGGIIEFSGAACYSLSAMTATYYGFLWCGGVCPIDSVPAMAHANGFVTAGDIVAGAMVVASAAAGTGLDLITLNPAAAHAPFGRTLTLAV